MVVQQIIQCGENRRDCKEFQKDFSELDVWANEVQQIQSDA